MPSQLNITLTTSGNPVVIVTISSALQGLDGSSGQASAQTGYNAVDATIANIFRRGAFLATNGISYPVGVIQSISWQ